MAGTSAVVISVVSLLVAIFALGWNVYRDVVLKARLRVRASVSSVVIQGVGTRGTYLGICGTNFGPGELKVNMIWGQSSPLLLRMIGRSGNFAVLTDGSSPYATKLPATIQVGDSVDVLLPWQEDCFLKGRVHRIGLGDSFGRRHWASRKDLAALKKQYAKDFGSPID